MVDASVAAERVKVTSLECGRGNPVWAAGLGDPVWAIPSRRPHQDTLPLGRYGALAFIVSSASMQLASDSYTRNSLRSDPTHV